MHPINYLFRSLFQFYGIKIKITETVATHNGIFRRIQKNKDKITAGELFRYFTTFT